MSGDDLPELANSAVEMLGGHTFVKARVQDERDVMLFRRDAAGKIHRKVVPGESSCFLRAADVDADLRRTLASSTNVAGMRSEGEWLRVRWRDSQTRRFICGPGGPFVSKGIPTYEGDVDPVRRLITDTGAVIQKPRRCYLDIETDSRVPFSKKEEMRVLSWAVVDDAGVEGDAVLADDTDKDEDELLAKLTLALAGYDQVLAWNGDNFDFPVLSARMGSDLGHRLLLLDHLAMFKRMNTAAESGDEKQSMRLQDIAMATIGEGKDKFDASRTWEAWLNKTSCASGDCARCRACLVKYNLKDTVLLAKLEKETGFADLFGTLADVCRVFADTDGLNPTKQVDGYMLRLGAERGIRFPTKQFRENPAKYKGAFVMEPRANGIERDVHVCDFSSLYPSIILTWNMSPESKATVPVSGPVPKDRCRAPSTRQGFRLDVDGILPMALRQLGERRKEWNDRKAALPPGTPEWHDADRRQAGYKVAGLAFYGVVGSPFSRYFDPDIAEAVTQNGVWLIKRTIEEAELRNIRVVYGDTDSAFATGCSRTAFEEFVRWCNEDLYPRIIKEHGCTENHIKLAYEKQFERIVFVSAKRYAGKYFHYKGKAATKDSKPEIRGLEYRRGDTALLARRLQGQAIDLLMGGEEGTDKYKGILDAALQRILNEPLPLAEVVLSKSLSKPLREYEQRRKKDGAAAAEPPHVQIARELKKKGQEVGEGTRIEFFVVDGSPGAPNVVRHASEYGHLDADRYYLWESLVYPPTQRLLEAAFPGVDWKVGYEKIRPPKLKGKAKRQAEVQEQGQLVLVRDGAPLEVVVDEEHGDALLELLQDVFNMHPGNRPATLRIQLESGAEAILAPKAGVSGSEAFLSDVELARAWCRAAIGDLEASCAG